MTPDEPRVLDERTHPDVPIALTVVEYPSGAVHIDAADHALVTTGGILLRRRADIRELIDHLEFILEPPRKDKQ